MCKNLLKSLSLWSHSSFGNLNKVGNASSPGFFSQMLDSKFKSIYAVSHKFVLKLFLIDFPLFCKKNYSKKISIEILFNLRLLLRWSTQFSCTYRKSSLIVGIFLRVLSYPFFKSKMSLGYPEILIVVKLIII